MHSRFLPPLFAAICLNCGIHESSAETFRFQYAEGEQYRIVSQVDQEVFINGNFSHRADILNRIAVSVIGVEDGSGRLDVVFQTSERAFGEGGLYEWAEDYQSGYLRDPLGAYDIKLEFFMPVVRNVPLFPERVVEVGESWSGTGEEVHDFRANFGVPDTYRFPIEVSYRYLGAEELDGNTYDLISIRYAVFHKAAPQYGLDLYPVRITGFSDQMLYWDNNVGRPFHYSEEYDFLITLSSGDEVEYVGTAEATIVEATRMEKIDIAEAIREELDRAEIDDAEVRVSDVGVTLSLENIQFLPDSAILMTSEKKKLDVVADILKRYPERDILVGGHTALAGTEAGRFALSDERARAVGLYLLEIGARSQEHIVTRGFGATEPIADNRTEEGMRRNRRVEITLLEN